MIHKEFEKILNAFVTLDLPDEVLRAMQDKMLSMKDVLTDSEKLTLDALELILFNDEGV